jgi:hypothetical protein
MHSSLVIGVVLIEADQGSKQGEAKLLEGGVVGVGAALQIDVSEDDPSMAEHMTADPT